MSRRDPNIIDTIAGIIPGYRGYADRDARRTTDKMLRDSVAQELAKAQREVRDFALARTNAGQLEGLDELDRLVREIGTCADGLRLAPTGGSGLMDDVVVKAEDLDRAHAHDLTIGEQATALTAAAAAACASGDVKQVVALRDQVKAIRDAVAQRAAVLSGGVQ